MRKILYILTLVPLNSHGFTLPNTKLHRISLTTLQTTSIAGAELDDLVISDPSFDSDAFDGLYAAIVDDPSLKLQAQDDYRGIYATRDFKKGDTVLSVPLEYCLRDDQPPQWQSSGDWAVRLASAFLEAQKQPSDIQSLWFSILPNQAFLKASLPVHWSDDVLKQAASTALEVSTDSRFFSRADATQQILDVCKDFTNLEISHALDIVQTRTCRIEAESATEPQPLRLLAPIFDCINHSHDSNCGFELRDENLVVLAKRDIRIGDEITIDYGSSARPAWNCLSSYGFVPTTDLDESFAEVFIEGKRFEVGPSAIPEDIVLAVDQAATSLTPLIAMQLSKRISKLAYSLLLDPWNKTTEDNPIEILSSRIAASMRFYQHRILLECANGLEEWAQEN